MEFTMHEKKQHQDCLMQEVELYQLGITKTSQDLSELRPFTYIFKPKGGN